MGVSLRSVRQRTEEPDEHTRDEVAALLREQQGR